MKTSLRWSDCQFNKTTFVLIFEDSSDIERLMLSCSAQKLAVICMTSYINKYCHTVLVIFYVNGQKMLYWELAKGYK